MDKKAGDALTDEDLRGPPPPDERPAPPPADGEEGGRLTTAEMEAARCCTRFQRVVLAFLMQLRFISFLPKNSK